jgi:glycosyltransferase involved in cell wall biosynthesis
MTWSEKVTGKIDVTFFHRRPRQVGNFSIERVFDIVRARLPTDIKPTKYVLSRESKGLLARLQIALEASRHQADVNHITGDIHFIALLLNRKRTILTIHDVLFMEHPNPLARWLLYWFWLELPIHHAKIVTVVSEATKKQLSKYIACPPGKVRVVHNPVDTQFEAVPKPFNKDHPVILQVGTAHNKNIARLIGALVGIPCQLKIIGRLSDDHVAKLKEAGLDYQIAWNLSDEQMRQQYIDCDMVVLASTHEGFGLPIIEGNMVGRPVITSNVSSLPEVAGNAAHLVDPYSPASIREGVLKVIHDDEYRSQLIANGFKNCLRFDPETIAGQYAALYREVARI